MLSWVAATAGGLAKDAITVAEKLFTTAIEEIASIPESFNKGYEAGLFTGPDQLDDPSTLTKEQIEELTKELTPKFGQK